MSNEDLGMHEAFGRDPHLERSIAELVDRYGIATILECGSWKGYTARRMADMARYVHTIDCDPEMHKAASATNADAPNVVAHLGDSAETLRLLIPIVTHPCLFYLDAHWFDRWPILDEIRVIAETCPTPAVIVVHDCQVPDRPEFGYDTYNRTPLSFEYVKPELDRLRWKWSHSYNRVAEGHRRGVMFVTPVHSLMDEE